MGSYREDLEFLRMIETQVDEEDEEPNQFQDEEGVLRNREKPEPENILVKGLKNLESLKNSSLKGAIKGIGQVGSMFGPLTDQPQPEVSPNEALDQLLNTNKDFFNNTLERGTELATLLASGGELNLESIIRSFTGGALSEASKEFGSGKKTQTALETLALMSPKLSKNIVPKNADQKRLIDFARENGLTEKQIAPLLQDEGRLKSFLVKISPKGGRTKKALEQAKEGKDILFNRLKSDPANKQVLTGVEQAELFNDITNKLKNISVEERNRILLDYNELVGSKGDIADIVNFYEDINSKFSGERDKLQLVKGPILKALRKKNPAFAEKFEITNDLASRYHSINQRLKPTKLTEGIEVGRGLFKLNKSIDGIVTGNYRSLLSNLGETGARQVAREMLINPRFQNLSRQIIEAGKKNKVGAVRNVWGQIAREFRKQGINQDTIDKLQDVTKEELQEFIDLLKEEKND